jgi:beta-ureidopropionase
MRSSISRRRFLENVSIAAGTLAVPTVYAQNNNAASADSFAKKVTIATVSTMDLTAKNSNELIQKVLGVMEEIIPMKPDIICLPEIFAFAHIEEYNYKLADVAEKVPGPVVTPFMKFAAKNNCYVICPTYTLHNDNVYISGVVIDRKGKVIGEYHKMRPAASEVEMGIKAGKFDPPVFDTDFGKIGIQICFDIKYEEGWNALKDKGAQIIFWPSAYAAGQEICTRAWRHQLYVVSSTQKDTSRICDITGEVIAQTGRWQRNWIAAPINLEKAFILTWPAVSLFPDIQKKYGSRLKLTTYSEEEWTIIESLDPNLKVAAILQEYKLKTMHEILKDLSAKHDKSREQS